MEGQKEEELADRGAATGRRGHQKTHPVSQSARAGSMNQLPLKRGFTVEIAEATKAVSWRAKAGVWHFLLSNN